MTTTTRIPTALDTTIPFSRAEARAAGIGDRALRSPTYQRLFHDTYLSSAVTATTLVRAAAALRKMGAAGAYASHHTAAEIWGIPVPNDGLVHVTAAGGDGRNRCRGVITHQPLAAGARVVVRDGVRVSTPDQVFCELAAAGLGLVDLVVAGDAMLKAKRVSHTSLREAVVVMRGGGVRLARRAFAYLRDGVDSAMESRLRMLLVLAGFPEPQVNVIMRTADGDWARRFDLGYRALKLLIEYDGDQHGELEHRESDNDRREQLERLGYKIVPVTSLGIYRDPAKTLRRVADAMRDLGGHPPGRWRPEWRQHFPGQRSRRTS